MKRKKIFSHIPQYAGYQLHEFVPSVTPGPLMISIMLTEKCNLRCQFCDLWCSNKLKDSEVVFDRKYLAPLMKELGDANVMLVNLLGGEPLLYPNIEEIVQEINKWGMYSSLVTNGTMLTEKKVQALLDADLDFCVVSIDSPYGEIHDELRGREGSFKKACEGLQRLKKMGGKNIWVGVNTVISNKNCKDLVKMYEFAASLGVDALRFMPITVDHPFNKYEQQDASLQVFSDINFKDLENSVQELLKMKRKGPLYTNSEPYFKGLLPYFKGKTLEFRCDAGISVCEIDVKRNIYPCLMWPSAGVYGDENTFDKIWHSQKFKDLRKGIRVEKCNRCWQACFVEPSFRGSFFYLMSNYKQIFSEMTFFMKRKFS